ncbi:N-acetylmuramoyl-L-alanine amidase [Paenibacillus macerans]|uniref:N-acetylmuramoyl-L-alanine amidase n=1 Tax=Paenibacillus macerans TaxID=44252 RepID=UPI00203DC869|nr:N-acetylmuramoyl-L-alanine amidase [Paenibacillus macerans]MCM3701627.1 N-acetylmuramoyl-L-alanine amidase [Paenibacillus macerans]
MVEFNERGSIENGNTHLLLTIDHHKVLVDNKEETLEIPPMLIRDTAMVPLRFVAERFGLNVVWLQQDRSIYLTNNDNAEISDHQDMENPASNLSDPLEEATIARGELQSITYDEQETIHIKFTGTMTPVSSFLLDHPDRLVVDLPNTILAADFSSAHVSSLDRTVIVQSDADEPADQPKIADGSDLQVNGKLLDIRYSQFSDQPSVVRIVLDVAPHVKYELTQNAEEIQIKLLEQEESSNTTTNETDSGNKIFKVVIDPGHGAKDPGATGITGYLEKDYNLSLSLKVKNLLENEEQIETYLTRNDDTFVELADRAAFANNLDADLFISLHANSLPGSGASGTETFYYSSQSKKLGEIIQKHVVAVIGLPDRGVKSAGYVVIKQTKMPAVLMESAFLSNKKDEAILKDDKKQQEIAEAIVEGIKEYLQIS